MQPPNPEGTTPAPSGPPRSVYPDSSRFAPDARIGPYCLVRRLGSGGFGEVWLARRESAVAASLLALKLPHATVDLSATRQEAEVWVRATNHPNVLPFFEANTYDGQPVIASEYAPDGSLKDWLDRHGKKAPTVEAAVDMAMGVLSGLEHLHVRGVVHRDLKPANILMQGECPRIADFGLARLIDAAATATHVAGSPAYMAPESFDGRRSVQTDLWAVGIVLHQMLAGELPFRADGGEWLQLMKVIATAAPPPLPAAVPGSVRQVVRTALAKDAGERFRTAADMRAALRDALRQSDVAVPAPVAPRGGRTVAVTGSMRADPAAVARRLPALLAPYLGTQTTWYCGTSGAVDEFAAEHLLGAGQRVIGVGYAEFDISARMRTVLDRYAAPFVNAQDEPVPPLSNAPSVRDIFFSTKADLLVVLWDGQSRGVEQLLGWLRTQGKDHVIGFV